MEVLSQSMRQTWYLSLQSLSMPVKWVKGVFTVRHWLVPLASDQATLAKMPLE